MEPRLRSIARSRRTEVIVFGLGLFPVSKSHLIAVLARLDEGRRVMIQISETSRATRTQYDFGHEVSVYDYSKFLRTTGEHLEGVFSSSIHVAINVPLFSFGSIFLGGRLIAAVSTVGAPT